MKKSIFAVAATAALLGLSFQASAGIANTKHNLSSQVDGVNGLNRVYSTDNPEICIYCHTPHNAIKNDTIPLWNHDLSTVATYGMYTSPTFDGEGTIADLGGVDATTATVSNLCLSCHDGTVAINAVNNPSNGNPTITMTGVDPGTGGLLDTYSTNLSDDLLDDHPVNFVFDSALASADPSLHDPVDAKGSGLSGGVKLFAGRVQCPSCHNPHNDTVGEQPFLRDTINGSQLCLNCHDK